VTENIHFEIGKRYSVPCVKTVKNHKWDRLWRGEWIPVIGPEHQDAEIIGFPWKHWHVDWRFASEGVFKRTVRQKFGFQDSGIVFNYVLQRFPVQQENDGTKYETDEAFHLGEVAVRRVTCKRAMPAYPYKLATWLPKLATACAGMRMKNMVCPHRGMPLKGCPLNGDVVTCPGHGLRWNVKTGELVT
jgi:hypothetical protein